jgi:hypothetical protein
MANHTGFIIIAANGKYLLRIEDGVKTFWTLTPCIDAATFFPFTILPNPMDDTQDWTGVVRSLNDSFDKEYERKDIEQGLIAIPATSFQRIEIGEWDNEA